MTCAVFDVVVVNGKSQPLSEPLRDGKTCFVRMRPVNYCGHSWDAIPDRGTPERITWEAQQALANRKWMDARSELYVYTGLTSVDGGRIFSKMDRCPFCEIPVRFVDGKSECACGTGLLETVNWPIA